MSQKSNINRPRVILKKTAVNSLKNSKLVAAKPNRTVFKVISGGTLQKSSDISYKDPTSVSKVMYRNTRQMSSNNLQMLATVAEAGNKRRKFNLVGDRNISANVQNDSIEDTMPSEGDDDETKGISHAHNQKTRNNAKAMYTSKTTIKDADKLHPDTRKFIFWLQTKAALAESRQKAVVRLRAQVNRLKHRNEELTAAIEIMKAQSLDQY